MEETPPRKPAPVPRGGSRGPAPGKTARLTRPEPEPQPEPPQTEQPEREPEEPLGPAPRAPRSGPKARGMGAKPSQAARDESPDGKLVFKKKRKRPNRAESAEAMKEKLRQKRLTASSESNTAVVFWIVGPIAVLILSLIIYGIVRASIVKERQPRHASMPGAYRDDHNSSRRDMWMKDWMEEHGETEQLKQRKERMNNFYRGEGPDGR
ncbi:MAG: hypothetical protein R6V03_09180 [Kiritimatiellia bacterium]